MSAIENSVAQDDLESLLVNNGDLDKLTAYLTRFNPIRVMGMESMEIRHSAILAWLLDPIETHGFEDAFLKSFLSQALRGAEGSKPSALEVSQADLRDAEIQREQRNIDIFVTSPQNGWAFVIENKFHSKQSDGQLARYIERAEKDAKDSQLEFRSQGIFLTLHEEAPDAGIAEKYVTLRYADVCDILASLMGRKATNLSPEVRQFLEHYLEIIMDAADMSDEQAAMQKMARELYRTHKKAIDFIVEHGASSDFAVAVQSVFGEALDKKEPGTFGGQTIRFVDQFTDWLGCIPTEWENVLTLPDNPWKGCETWWAGYPLIIWIRLDKMPDGVKGKLRIVAEIGPLSEHAVRQDLVQRVDNLRNSSEKFRIQFTKTAKQKGTKYSRFLKGNVVSIKDTGDADEIAAAIRRLLTDFEPEISAVAGILPGFVSDQAGAE